MLCRALGVQSLEQHELPGAASSALSLPLLCRAVHHYGRAVIMFGVPYVYTQSRILKVSSAWGVGREGLCRALSLGLV